MKKIVYQDSNEELWRSAYGNMITLIESDKNIKTASSSSVTRELMDRYRPDKDHFMCHIIALGDYETYGCNRNADSFPKEANIKHHKTFEKFAKVYREHDAKEGKDIGEIKFAMYNPDMHRTELILWGNKKKAAMEWDKIKEGKMLSGSMGCSVKHDRDNLSGKLCKHASEYEPWMKFAPCKFISSWTVDGKEKTFNKVACVHNDDPKFVDYSFVECPADRIAYALEYSFDDLSKVASIKRASDCIPSALLPESKALIIPGSVFEDDVKTEIFENLAKTEEDMGNKIECSIGDNKPLDMIDDLMLNSWDDGCDLEDSECESLRKLRSPCLFNEMNKRGILLPFEMFLKLFAKKSDEELKSPVVIYAKNVILPNAFSYMKDQKIPVMDECLFDEGNDFDSKYDLANDFNVQNVLDSIADRFSVMDEPLVKRRMIIAIKKASVKSYKPVMQKMASKVLNTNASLTREDLNMANKYIADYCNYKVAAIKGMMNHFNIDSSLINILAVGQDYSFNLD